MENKNLENKVVKSQRSLEKELNIAKIIDKALLGTIICGAVGMVLGGLIGKIYQGYTPIEPEFLNSIDAGYIGGMLIGMIPPLIYGNRKIKKLFRSYKE